MKTPSVGIRRQEPARIQVPDGEVLVIESHHASDFTMESGRWPYHKICWVAVGRGSVEVSGNRSGIVQHDFIVLPAELEHRFLDDPSEPLTLVILCISRMHLNENAAAGRAELWEQLLQHVPPGQPCCAKTGFHQTSLIENFRLALREQANQKVGWQTAMKSTADRILIAMCRGFCEPRDHHHSTSEQTICGAIEYLDAHPYENLRIEEMAERCRLSPRRFTDLFKQQTGKTYNQYINCQRIRYACRRLDETGHIAYACFESGFNDLAYFYRVFKKQTGLTPGEYIETTVRKSAQNSH